MKNMLISVQTKKTCQENAKTDIEKLLEKKVRSGVLENLIDRKLVSISEDRIQLTSSGEDIAESVIRRKRLAERLLKDVLNVREEYIDPAACQWEHTLSKEVTNSICTLLGHPSHSPLERPIPPGECCKNASRTTAPVICSLDNLQRGDEAKVIYLLSKQRPELNRLLSMGLVPGSKISVVQRMPTYVVHVGESQLAFDESIAAGAHDFWGDGGFEYAVFTPISFTYGAGGGVPGEFSGGVCWEKTA
jgi:DtxR family Mn-dependent transcriptional regulator